MDIRLYDFDFNLLGIMSDVISSTWCIKYNGVGTYNGKFRLADRISDIILENKYLVIIEGDNQAVCTGKVANRELLLCGRTVNWLLEKRVLPPFKTREIFNGEYVSPYTIGKLVLERCFTEPPRIDENGDFIAGSIDENRRVENFTLPAEHESMPLERHFWRNSANSAEDIITDVAEMMDRGHRLIFNIKNKSWDFEYISGTERNILLCEANRNFYNATYTMDLLDEADGGWYNVYSDSLSDTEESRNDWKYVKKSNVPSGMRYWEAALEVNGEAEAESAINKKQIISRVQGTLMKLKYKVDYDLGDVIRVRAEYGEFSEEKRYKITGVNIWINKDGSGQEPVLTMIEEG